MTSATPNREALPLSLAVRARSVPLLENTGLLLPSIAQIFVCRAVLSVGQLPNLAGAVDLQRQAMNDINSPHLGDKKNCVQDWERVCPDPLLGNRRTRGGRETVGVLDQTSKEEPRDRVQHEPEDESLPRGHLHAQRTCFVSISNGDQWSIR